MIYFLFFAALVGGDLIRRSYFLRAELVDWAYVDDTGRDVAFNVPLSDEQLRFVRRDVSAGQLGARYRKAVFVQYTDATFTTRAVRAPEQQHLGLLGPLMRVSDGDELSVTVQNSLRHPLQLFAQGVLYAQRNNETVAPSATKTYVWFGRGMAPSDFDSSSVLRLYYGSVLGQNDVHSGLVGGIVWLRDNVLNLRDPDSLVPANIDRLLVFVSQMIDERRSHLAVDNARDAGVDPALVDAVHERKFCINGRMFGSLGGLGFLREGERVRVLVASLVGSGDGTSSLVIEGHAPLITHQSHAAGQSPFMTESYDIVVRRGRHVVVSGLAEHTHNGLSAVLEVGAALESLPLPPPRATQTVYLRSEEIDWAYDGVASNTTVRKCFYKLYNDARFTQPAERPSYAGLSGPLLRFVAGNLVVVHFENNCTIAAGVAFDLLTPLDYPPPPALVESGQRVVLNYRVPRPPREAEVAHLYSPSHNLAQRAKLVQAGLFGPYAINRDTDDLHLTLIAMKFDDALSAYATTTTTSRVVSTLNGFADGAMPTREFASRGELHLIVGSASQSTVFTTDDVIYLSRLETPTNAVQTGPSRMREVEIIIPLPGRRFFAARIGDDVVRVAYTTNETASNAAIVAADRDALRSRSRRRIFLRAEVIDWDYAPQGRSLIGDKYAASCTGAACWPEQSWPYVERSATRIGTKYQRYAYVQYTDATYTKRVESSTLNYKFMSPVMRMRSDELLAVTIANSINATISFRIDGLEQLADEAGRVPRSAGDDNTIAPRSERTMFFHRIEDELGEDVHDSLTSTVTQSSFQKVKPSTIAYLYRDTLLGVTGLFGLLIITDRDAITAADNLAPKDVDREVILCVGIDDENRSPLLARNVAAYAPQANVSDPKFIESNRKPAINGFIGETFDRFGQHDAVRLYMLATPHASELYTVHMHGSALRVAGSFSDTMQLAPRLGVIVADMTPVNRATWQIDVIVDGNSLRSFATQYTVTNARPAVSSRITSPTERPVDGRGSTLLHAWGRAGRDLWARDGAPSELSSGGRGRLPAPGAVSSRLLRALPPQLTARQPAVSSLLSAISALVVADLVDLSIVDREGSSTTSSIIPFADPLACLKRRNATTTTAAGSAACLEGVAHLESALADELTVDEQRELLARAVGDEYNRAALKRVVPPNPINYASPWIDLSPVYGANEEAARAMRTFRGGELTTDRSRWTPSVRHGSVALVVAVDVFVRDHNRRAAIAARENPTWTDEQLYADTRFVVLTEAQHVTLDEWLPLVTGVPLPNYDGDRRSIFSSGIDDVVSPTMTATDNVLETDFYSQDERADVSTTFALACAPALLLSSTPQSIELVNAKLESLLAKASIQHVTLADCSGNEAKLERCLRFGVEPVLRGLFREVAPAVDASVADTFDMLRVGDPNERVGLPDDGVDAVTEWIMRGRLAMLPSFADMVRARGATVPTTFASLVGLPASANLSALAAQAVENSRNGESSSFDMRALVAIRLGELYSSIEDVDLIVGLLVEPTPTPLTASVGPTLAKCLADQIRVVRRADRFWHDGVFDETRWASMDVISSSMMRYLMVVNYEFGVGAVSQMSQQRRFGVVRVPTELYDVRDAVVNLVQSATGGPPRSVRLGFHVSGTYDANAMKYGSSPDCFNYASAKNDSENGGLTTFGDELAAFRQSQQGARIAALSDADAFSLIGATAVSSASYGGVVVNWKPGRIDVPKGPDSASLARSLCPAAGNLPTALVNNDSFPYPLTLAAARKTFSRMGFNDREMVALIGAHVLGSVNEDTSGFPSGQWSRQNRIFSNQFFKNLLAFENKANRIEVKSTKSSAHVWRSVVTSGEGEIGVVMLPSDIALLADPKTKAIVQRYAANNALFVRDFGLLYSRLLELGSPTASKNVVTLPDTFDESFVDTQSLDTALGDDDAIGAPPPLPFYVTKVADIVSRVFAMPPPDSSRWQETIQVLPSMRFSFTTDETNVHVLLETPINSYFAMGIGPRKLGAKMEGGDIVMLLLRDDGTLEMRDTFVVYDLLPPIADSTLNGTSDWVNATAERRDGMTRVWMSRRRRTTDKWDQPIPLGSVDVMFSVGTVSLAEGTVDEVFGTYHGSSNRVIRPISFVLPTTTTVMETATLALRSTDSERSTAILIGVVVGVFLLLLALVLVGAYCYVRRARQLRQLEGGEMERIELVESERLPIAPSLTELSLVDANFPFALINAPQGILKELVPMNEFDVDLVLKRRNSPEEAAGTTTHVTRMLIVEQIYCDVIQIKNVSSSTRTLRVHLPEHRPQIGIACEPLEMRLTANAVGVFVVKVCMTCTTKQKFSIKISSEQHFAELPQAKIESELSTLLDFDEIRLNERIGEGSFGVVFAGYWRKSPVAIKLLKQQQFAAAQLEELRSEAKFLSLLRHKNIVEFRGAVFRESNACLVTELAPHGSLKSVLTSFGLPWELTLKICSDAVCGLQFLHASGIIHRDVKSDNVLVFSLNAKEAVVAKLTDFGSARNAKNNVDIFGKVQGDRARGSNLNGTPIYMSPELFNKSSRPSEASDMYALGVLFYEIATETEPWCDVPFSWDVAKAVISGRRPAWPAKMMESSPPPFIPLVSMMWAQEPGDRPRALDEVQYEIAACQEAIGDTAAAAATRKSIESGADNAATAAYAADERADSSSTTTRDTLGNVTDSPGSSVLPLKRSSLGAISFSSLDDDDDDSPDVTARKRAKSEKLSTLNELLQQKTSSVSSAKDGATARKQHDADSGNAPTTESDEVKTRGSVAVTKSAALIAKAQPTGDMAKRVSGGVVLKNRSLAKVSTIDSLVGNTTTTTTTTTTSDSEEKLSAAAARAVAAAKDASKKALPSTKLKAELLAKKAQAGLDGTGAKPPIRAKKSVTITDVDDIVEFERDEHELASVVVEQPVVSESTKKKKKKVKS